MLQPVHPGWVSGLCSAAGGLAAVCLMCAASCSLLQREQWPPSSRGSTPAQSPRLRIHLTAAGSLIWHNCGYQLSTDVDIMISTIYKYFIDIDIYLHSTLQDGYLSMWRCLTVKTLHADTFSHWKTSSSSSSSWGKIKPDFGQKTYIALTYYLQSTSLEHGRYTYYNCLSSTTFMYRESLGSV